jgi:predicted site-specific integrase-resolvase
MNDYENYIGTQDACELYKVSVSTLRKWDREGKIAHGKRVFCKPKEKKKITITDIKERFKIFNENRGNNEEKNETWKYLYT